MTSTLSRRDRKRLETRAALQRAALQLVAERGLDHVTVEMITEAADVSYRTFFNHFASKEEAVLAVGAGNADQFRADLADRPAGEPALDSMQALAAGVAGFFAAQSEETELRLRVVRDNPALAPRFNAMFTSLEHDIATVIAQRFGLDADRDLYPRLLAAVSIAAIRAAIELWRDTGRARPLADVVAEAFGQLAAGLPVISSPPGRDPGHARPGGPVPSAAKATEEGR